MEIPPRLLTAVGSFHPLLVHLPIGLLLGAVCLELWSAWRTRADLHAASGALVSLGAVAAVAAAGCGLLLAASGGYEEVLLERHERLGIATAGLAVFCAVLHRWSLRRNQQRRAAVFRLALAACTGALLAAAHFGGMITHGSATPFAQLAAALRDPPPPQAPADTAAATAESIFTQSVAPILQEHCQECHGEQKQKSGLRLDSRAAALAGGDSGTPAVVPGDAMASRLVAAITLPSDNKRAMPPAGKGRLQPDQVLAIVEWINRGAAWPDTDRPDVPPPDAEAIEHLRRSGFQLSLLALDHPLLRVDVVPRGVRLAELAPVARQVAWLDLSGFQLEKGDMQWLAKMSHLSRLELQNSNVSDADLGQLAGLERLVFLNLYGTAVGDAGIEQLSALRSLQRLYLWQTRVTEAGLKRLRAALPAAYIASGDAWSPAVATPTTSG